MKNLPLLKFLFLGLFLTLITNRCSVSDRVNSKASMVPVAKIQFFKSPRLDWKNKKVEVSFEDDFQEFKLVDTKETARNQSQLVLSTNHLKQGITVRVKMIDMNKKIEKINEIMIESYDLPKDINQFAIGYNENTPFIMY